MKEDLAHKRYLSSKEVEEVYGLTTRTLQTWRSKPFGPRFVKIDRKVLYDVRDIESFLEGYKKETVDEYIL